MVESRTCASCVEHVSVFLQFEADVCNFPQRNARLAALNTNQESRSQVFATYQRCRGCGGGERTRLETCFETGVRSWFPDKAYMGFQYDEDRKKRQQAIDMFGNKTILWWVYRDGAWILKLSEILSALLFYLKIWLSGSSD